MASLVSVQKIKSRNKITAYEYAPGNTLANDVAWVDMKDFKCFFAMFFRTIGTGAVSTFRIIANSASDGSGTDVEVAVSAALPDLLGDYASIEISEEQLASLGSNLRYVSLQLQFATGTDKGVVTYILGDSKSAQDALTVDSIA